MAKQKTRYRRKKKLVLAGDWPEDMMQCGELVRRVRYKESAEHKDYPSFAGKPGLRSDASRCNPTIDRVHAEKVLKEAIRRGCVSPAGEGGFPRYVWGRLNGQLYQARLINRDAGWYKAWPIEDIEAPADPAGRLWPELWND